MRAIDMIRVRTAIAEAWLENASDKTATLQQRHDEITARHAADQRAWRENLTKAVNSMETVWQDKDLKQALMDSSFGKCWYCEARVAQRADNAIDHPAKMWRRTKLIPAILVCLDWRCRLHVCSASARTTRDWLRQTGSFPGRMNRDVCEFLTIR
jgi:hypothetical protein